MPSGSVVVSVFAERGAGGNRVPVVLDADGLSDTEMQAVAHSSGLETAFLLAPERPGERPRLRYWVPNHEMSMCGHATIGTAWILHREAGRSGESTFTFSTLAGLVRAGADETGGWFEQAAGEVVSVQAAADVLAALGVNADDLAGRVENATAPRTKTLVPVSSRELLDALNPTAADVERVCEAVGSSGLYPYFLAAPGLVHARQFPKSSGYREDPATGVAAAALFFALRGTAALEVGQVLTVLQGAAMGRPSRITVEASGSGDVCRVRGDVVAES